MRSPPSGACAVVLFSIVSIMAQTSWRAPGAHSRSSLADAHQPLELTAGYRHAVGEEEIGQCEEQGQLQPDAAGDLNRCRLLGDYVVDVEEVLQVEDEHQRGVLEQAYRLADDRGYHGPY